MVTIVKKLTGGAYPFYEYACLSTDVKPASLVPENSICHEIDTGKHFYFGNGEWKELPPKGGSGGGSQGGGSGLPEPTRSGNIMQVSDDTGEWEQVAFPLASEDDVGKLIGITGKDGVYKYSSVPAPSGGGAEKFIVALAQDAQTEEWTADKTIAEIVAADMAGKDVVASFQYMGQLPTELPKVSWVPDPEGTSSVFMFSGIIYGESEEVAFIVGQPGDSSDMWQVTFTPIPTSSNAPLIVTLTAGQEAGTFVGDKTYQEAYEAFIAGRNVVFYASAVNGMAETVTVAENNTSAANPYALSTKSFASSGGASDYITVNAG